MLFSARSRRKSWKISMLATLRRAEYCSYAPQWVQALPRLDTRVKSVFGCIIQNNVNSYSEISISDIAHKLMLGITSVKYCISKLIKFRWIYKTRQGKAKPNVYEIKYEIMAQLTHERLSSRTEKVNTKKVMDANVLLMKLNPRNITNTPLTPLCEITMRIQSKAKQAITGLKSKAARISKKICDPVVELFKLKKEILCSYNEMKTWEGNAMGDEINFDFMKNQFLGSRQKTKIVQQREYTQGLQKEYASFRDSPQFYRQKFDTKHQKRPVNSAEFFDGSKARADTEKFIGTVSKIKVFNGTLKEQVQSMRAEDKNAIDEQIGVLMEELRNGVADKTNDGLSMRAKTLRKIQDWYRNVTSTHIAHFEIKRMRMAYLKFSDFIMGLPDETCKT